MKTVEQKVVIVYQQFEPGDIVALAGIQECEVVAFHLPPPCTGKPAMVEVKGDKHLRSADQFVLVRERYTPGRPYLFERYENRMAKCLDELAAEFEKQGYKKPETAMFDYRCEIHSPGFRVLLSMRFGGNDDVRFLFQVIHSNNPQQATFWIASEMIDRREARALDLALQQIEATDWQAVADKVMAAITRA